jgi:hypothetical protein
MTREVPLNRLKEQFVGIACESRPALADRDPALPLLDRLHYAWKSNVGG